MLTSEQEEHYSVALRIARGSKREVKVWLAWLIASNACARGTVVGVARYAEAVRVGLDPVQYVVGQMIFNTPTGVKPVDSGGLDARDLSWLWWKLFDAKREEPSMPDNWGDVVEPIRKALTRKLARYGRTHRRLL